MESIYYERLRGLSHRLFRNARIVPVAIAAAGMPLGRSLTLGQVEQELGGRLRTNQISEVLERLEEIGAVHELPYPGQPHPRTWERLESPFWAFLEAWVVQQMQTGVAEPERDARR